MLILELALQGVRGMPDEMVRLNLAQGSNVACIESDQNRRDIVQLLFHTLYPSTARTEATAALVADGASKSRVGVTFYGRDKKTYRLVRDVLTGSIALYVLDREKQSFHALTEGSQDTSQYLRVQERLPDEGDYDKLFIMSRESMASQGSTATRRALEQGSGLGPVAPGMPNRGISSMGGPSALGGGGGMFFGAGGGLDEQDPPSFGGFGPSMPRGGSGLMAQSALASVAPSSPAGPGSVEPGGEVPSESVPPAPEPAETREEKKERHAALLEEIERMRELEGANAELDELGARKRQLKELADRTRQLEKRQAELATMLEQHEDLLDFPDDMGDRVAAYQVSQARRDEELRRFHEDRADTDEELRHHEVLPLSSDRYFLGGLGAGVLSLGLAILLEVPFLAFLNIPGVVMAAGAGLRYVAEREKQARLRARLNALKERDERVERQYELETSVVRKLLATKASSGVDLGNLVDRIGEVRTLKKEFDAIQAELAERAENPELANAVQEYEQLNERTTYLEARLLGSDDKMSPTAHLERLTREVEALAKEIAGPGSGVSSVASAASGSGFQPRSSAPGASPPASPQMPEAGTKIGGRYVIDDRIGTGGFGAVYRARHTGTDQSVALKVLGSHGELNDVLVKRFIQEAKITAGLRHPNTVRVFDVGQDDSGNLFLAMELLTGKSLKEELQARVKAGGVFTEAEAVEIGIAITRSLSEAHAAGLVHRDLKPDNIFLHQVTGDDRPTVKVLDFGIAKLADSSITQTEGSTPGTPAYMSPEQAVGEDTDARSDLYSLGVILFALVCGKVPFRGESPMAVLYKHVNDPVPDVAEHARIELSSGFDRLITQCLQKQKEDRPTDAKELRGSLTLLRDIAIGRSVSQIQGAARATPQVTGVRPPDAGTQTIPPANTKGPVRVMTSAPGRPASKPGGVRIVTGTSVPADDDASDGYGAGYGSNGKPKGGGSGGGSSAAGPYEAGGVLLASAIGGGPPGGGGGSGYGGGGPTWDRTRDIVAAALEVLHLDVDGLREKHGPRIDQYLKAFTGGEYVSVTFDTSSAAAFQRPDGTAVKLPDLGAEPSDIVEAALHLALLEASAGAVRAPVIIDDPFKDMDPRRRQVFVKLLGYLGAVTQVFVLTSSNDITDGNQVQMK